MWRYSQQREGFYAPLETKRRTAA